MGKVLKTELYKAIWNPTFWLALLIGTGVCAINVVENYGTAQYIISSTLEGLENGSLPSPSFAGTSLFIQWIAVNGISMGNRAFYFIWPILAAMPYGWSYSREYRTGAMMQTAARAGIRKYFIAKYAAIFISGGLVVGLPVLLNLLANAMICPSITPSVSDSLVAVFDGQFMSVLFYTHPWAHGLIWCGIDFLFGGSAACLCLIVGSRFRLQVMVMLTPFALLLVLDSIYVTARSAAGWYVMLSPLSLASMVVAYPNPEIAVFGAIGALILVSFGIGWWHVVRHEQL